MPYIETSRRGIIPIAYAFSKPLIATNIGAIREMVDDSKTGLLVPPWDMSALSNYYSTLPRESKWEIMLIKNGIQVILGYIAMKTIEVYHLARKKKQNR